MDLIKDRPKLSLDEYFELENQLYEQGFLTDEYIPSSAPVTKHTSVKCPICGSDVITYAAGNSYEITCETEGCIRTGIRGI